MDLWPINMSRLSRRIDKINTLEVCDMTNYDSVENMQIMGFGRTPDQVDLVSARLEGAGEVAFAPFYASALMLSHALRFPLEAIRFETAFGLATEPIAVAVGVIEPGSVAVVKLRQVGESGGRDVLCSEWVWRTTDSINPEWGVGEYWSMTVEGDPDMHCRLEAATRFDSKRIVSLVVATNVVNSIPALCDATSGVKSALDLPPCGGGVVPSPVPIG
jgi:4-hydroxy-tetrahydrodipicolinate reductase